MYTVYTQYIPKVKALLLLIERSFAMLNQAGIFSLWGGRGGVYMMPAMPCDASHSVNTSMNALLSWCRWWCKKYHLHLLGKT